jgi:hypothetical protein
LGIGNWVLIFIEKKQILIYFIWCGVQSFSFVRGLTKLKLCTPIIVKGELGIGFYL